MGKSSENVEVKVRTAEFYLQNNKRSINKVEQCIIAVRYRLILSRLLF